MSISSWLSNLSVRIGLLVALLASPGARGFVRAAQEPPAASPPTTTAEAPPTVAPATPPFRPSSSDVIILDGAADLADFWRKLAERDYMILRPEPAAAAAEPAPTNPNPSPSHVVNSVQIRGSIDGDLARLELGVNCSVLVAEPVWAPLRLDEPGLLAAKEDARELELRRNPENQWEVRLQGSGEHRFRVELLRPIRGGAERKSLELAIPEAPATSLDLSLPATAFDIDLGSDETIGRTVAADGKRVRLFGHIAPRSRLVLGWSEPGAAGSRAAPLLTAQVEMAVDVDSESVATRSSWAIRCDRGVARSLQIRLDDDETVARLQLNDQFPASGIEQAAEGSLLTIPLDDPLRPGETRRLVLETRRPSAAGGPPVVFSGYPLTDAGEQSGAIGITHGPDLFLNVVSTRGLRRIDPRDLPSALKARPGTTIALQFLERGLHLELGVESSPPLYRADSTTDLTFESDIVRNETTLNLQRVRGVLFEVEINVPPELKILSIGPPELVESTTAALREPTGEAGADHEAGTLKIRLTASGRDQRSLILKFSGAQPIPNAGDARIGLFSPRGAVSTTTSLALHSGPGLTVEALEESLTEEETPPPTAPTSGDGAAKPPAATSPPNSGPRLRGHRNLDALNVRLERHALAITHDARLGARVSRRVVTVRQETALRVRHGTVQSLVIRVPERAAAFWNVSGGGGAIRREDLGSTAKGIHRYRLAFDRPIIDGSTLVFEYRLPPSRALETSAATEISIPWIAIEEGSPGNLAVDLSSDADVALNVDDANWARMDDEAGATAERGLFRLVPRAAATSLNISARLLESVALPPLVVSKALIQSTLGADGELRVRARYAIETPPESLSLSPPPNAQWLQIRVDGRAIEQLGAQADGSNPRLEIPAESRSRPAVIDLEYRIPAKDARKGWGPPILLAGADVLQSYWLARVPWKTALIGVPEGWSDENRWYWDYYVWKRRPVASASELAGWVAGPSAQADFPAGTAEAESTALHGYLFGRTGAGADLKPWVASRAWIIVICSGLALLAGLGLLVFPFGERWVFGGGAVLGLATAILVPPVVIALLLQAATPGLLLALLGWLVHRSARRGGAAAPPSPGSATSAIGSAHESSRRSAFMVGSDDSTAIRRRVPSTLDYRSEPTAPLSGLETARGSGVEPAPRAE